MQREELTTCAQIVMRISRLDPDDPSGKRRRHFEISIDSPFTVLNCRATQANTSLPQYSGHDGPVTPEPRQQMSCGCPDAQPVDPSSSGLAAPLAMVEEDVIGLSGRRLRLNCASPASLPRLSTTGVGAEQSTSGTMPAPTEPLERPIHLIRHPSHNPPAFDADEPPPPLPSELQTPPPHYDIIVGTPSVDGLADYFARLAAYEKSMCGGATHPESESDSTTPASGPAVATAPATPSTSTAPTPAKEPPAPLAGGDAPDADTRDNVRAPPTPGNGPDASLEPKTDAEADAEAEAEADDDAMSSDSAEDGPARPHRRGRVNVANPRTPGGRRVPSRSLDIERPVVRLDMSAVLRRRNAA